MGKRHVELSKTARASLGTAEFMDHLTEHVDPTTGKRIMLSQLYPVKVMRGGRTYMVYHDRDTYRTS